MEKSQSIKHLASALVKFASAVDRIGKSASNPFFKSKYAPLPEILKAIAEPLQIAGLAISQHPTTNALITILIHAESGEYLQSEYPLTPAKQDAQGIGSAITYARRYAIGAILNLNIDDDDDGNEASNLTKQETAKKAPSQRVQLVKVTDDGDIHPNWIKVCEWVRGGGDLSKLVERYTVSSELMSELIQIAKRAPK